MGIVFASQRHFSVGRDGVQRALHATFGIEGRNASEGSTFFRNDLMSRSQTQTKKPMTIAAASLTIQIIGTRLSMSLTKFCQKTSHPASIRSPVPNTCG